MDMILWRHAEAEDGAPALSDSVRQLTEHGRAQAADMAKWLRMQLSPVLTDTSILVSPAVRAQQTAEALTHNFETVQEVGTSASANQILAAANWPYAKGTVIVVGHQPTLGETACLLLNAIPDDLSFKKGALWWFRYCKRDEGAETVLYTVRYPFAS